MTSLDGQGRKTECSRASAAEVLSGKTPAGRRKKFCSDECRVKWWNAHQNQVSRKAVYEFTCAYCGKSFTVYGNNHRKYCSHDCYIKDRFGDTRGNTTLHRKGAAVLAAP
jgi:hypothetical protein